MKTKISPTRSLALLAVLLASTALTLAETIKQSDLRQVDIHGACEMSRDIDIGPGVRMNATIEVTSKAKWKSACRKS